MTGNSDHHRELLGELGRVDEPRFRPPLSGEEIRRRKDLHVRADELLPRRGLLALRRGRYTVAFQNVTDGFVSGLTISATSSSALFPSFQPISARVRRSSSVRRKRAWTCFRRIRFSAAR